MEIKNKGNEIKQRNLADQRSYVNAIIINILDGLFNI